MSRSLGAAYGNGRGRVSGRMRRGLQAGPAHSQRSSPRSRIIFDKSIGIPVLFRTMLVIPSDSGYNSPCDGLQPSSSFESPCFSKPFLPHSGNSLRVNRKLCFSSPFPSSESDFDSGSALHSSAFLSKKIARRLLRLCDSFEKEFVIVSEHSKNSSWTYGFIRSLGF